MSETLFGKIPIAAKWSAIAARLVAPDTFGLFAWAALLAGRRSGLDSYSERCVCARIWRTRSGARLPRGESRLVLMSGKVPPGPSELLGSQETQELMSAFEEWTDCVTPPQALWR